jgi:hypothetical protein
MDAYNKQFGFESSRAFVECMDELDNILADGYCEAGDCCNCGGDAKAVKMSCCLWVKPS